MKTRSLGAVLAVVVGLVGGCEKKEDVKMCAAYACGNGAKLTGTTAVSTPPTLVDVSFCSDGCKQGLVDVAQDPTLAACATWGQSSVCLKPSDGGLDVEATWGYDTMGDPPPDGTEYRLTLTDHVTGQTLLDVTRTTRYELTRVDNCHRCWYAEMSL
ncbi:MAG TPA: hypothetical protein VNG33_16625 [Polyangiaceae bacterium]|nr:hypothetical protein [Polyangiaceae bacterium]